MRFQGIATILLVAGLSTAVMLACSAPDPGEIQTGERVFAPNGGPGGSSSSGGASSSSGGASSSSSSSGAPAGDAFAGAAAYSATTPAPNNAPAKGKGNATVHGAQLDPAGLSCLPCHAGFNFGGTVYGEAAGTTRVAGAEVRIVDATGKQVSLVSTDADGNVWDTVATKVADGFKVGVRKDGKVKVMATPLKAGDGSCARTDNNAGCHSAGKQGPIYLN
jgi:hypothetical protein